MRHFSIINVENIQISFKRLIEISRYSCLCCEMWLHLSVLFLAGFSSLTWRKVCRKTWCTRLSWNTQKSLWFWNSTVRSSSLTHRVRNTQNTKHTHAHVHMEDIIHHKQKTCFIHSFNIKCIYYNFYILIEHYLPLI